MPRTPSLATLCARHQRARDVLARVEADIGGAIQATLLSNDIETLQALVQSLPPHYSGCRRIYEKIYRLQDANK